MKIGTINLPLHGGKAPRWLFYRMEKLSREIILLIVSEYGPEEMLSRLSDPLWFQAFGCALGFDWHSSGVTTTVCGAVKMAVKGLEKELGLFVAGGKGGTSRKTPSEIENAAERMGKDGIPYPVNRENYDRSIEILHKALRESKIGKTEKINAIRRLSAFYG